MGMRGKIKKKEHDSWLLMKDDPIKHIIKHQNKNDNYGHKQSKGRSFYNTWFDVASSSR
jgi:hypothetical protein